MSYLLPLMIHIVSEMQVTSLTFLAFSIEYAIETRLMLGISQEQKIVVVFRQVGLCMHLRELPWFQQARSDSFFPRCYRLSHQEDRQAFVGKDTLKCFVISCALTYIKLVHCVLEQLAIIVILISSV